MYELIYDSNGKVSTVKKIIADSPIPITMFIPICEGNSDYQDFLKWNKEQESPLDLNSTIEIVPIEPARDLAKEIDELKAQAKVNSENIATIATATDVEVKPIPVKEEIVP
jgi:hypothetical protein